MISNVHMVSEWDPLGLNAKKNNVCVFLCLSICVSSCAGSDAETQGRGSGAAKDSNGCPPGAP